MRHLGGHRAAPAEFWQTMAYTYLAQIMTAAGDNAILVVGRRRSQPGVEK